ncbi:M1 family metallopeptidase [Maribellus sediminis]|uniref:M1 family metallopeptidase n=1 Tax=Maribellus sediminis TaxID=2696285 RepID=UPI001430789A|nr:M1 family metallopeptidase [Maribellus sediminis]
MIYRKLIALLIFIVTLSFADAQNHHKRFESIDVQHYRFELHLHDRFDQIEGKATVQIKFLKSAQTCDVDLLAQTKGKGMKVNSVVFEGKELAFSHKNSTLEIDFSRQINAGETVELTIDYFGTPADGLIISENKYGKRTFFGDNWPDRAHNWLPCVDHPSDKATVEFLVYAPVHYEVIGNGYLAEKTVLTDNIEFTHWKEDVPISTKVMVIGAADFVIGNDTTFNGIPVNAWVFEENREKGLENYRYTNEALSYFSELIGPYSYEKLAHVQSKTRYGGMENASCIFYSENSAISDRSQEELFAHEVAHQWFGNSATEQNWHHVWLSEGFATYLTHVYNQHFYGDVALKQGLQRDRERVIRYAQRFPAPIIDTTVTEYIRLLNANSYQKASWFLHMLRNKLGDETFFKGLQNYYAAFRNSTALTADFRKVMEEVSGEDLQGFFDQWLRQVGQPVLKWDWEQTSDSNLKIDVQQTKEEANFTFPLELKVIYNDNSEENFTVTIDQQKATFDVTIHKKVQKLVLDPEVNLLYESAK